MNIFIKTFKKEALTLSSFLLALIFFIDYAHLNALEYVCITLIGLAILCMIGSCFYNLKLQRQEQE